MPASPAPPLGTMLQLSLAPADVEFRGAAYPGYPASNLLDGQLTTIAVTAQAELSDWVSFKLPDKTPGYTRLTYVAMYNRNDGYSYLLTTDTVGGNFQGFQVGVGQARGSLDALCQHEDAARSAFANQNDLGPFMVDCSGVPSSIMSSAAWMTVSHTGAARLLTLAEVELYSTVDVLPPSLPPTPLTPPPQCASWCQTNPNSWAHKCSSFDGCTGCSQCFQSPPPLPPGFSPPPLAPPPDLPPPRPPPVVPFTDGSNAFQQLAATNAIMSSTYSAAYPASNAIDGNLNTLIVSNLEATPWLTVEVPSPPGGLSRGIGYVVVYNRRDNFASYLEDFEILLSESSYSPGMTTHKCGEGTWNPAQWTYPIWCNGYWSSGASPMWVTLVKKDDGDTIPLSILELKVYEA